MPIMPRAKSKATDIANKLLINPNVRDKVKTSTRPTPNPQYNR